MSAFKFINDDSSGEEFADQSQSSDITFGSIDDIITELNNPTKQNPSQNQNSQGSQAISKKGSRVIGKQNPKTGKKSKDISKKPSAASRFAKKPVQGNLPSFAVAKTPKISNSLSFNDSTNPEPIIGVNNNIDSFLSATSSDPEGPLPDSADYTKSQNASSKQPENGYLLSVDKSDSNSAFSFTNIGPTILNDPNEMDFDFEAADENIENNDALQPTNLPSKNKESSLFSKIAKKKQTNNSPTNSQADEVVSNPKEKFGIKSTTPEYENPFKSDTNNPFSKNDTNNPFSKPSTAFNATPENDPESDQTRFIKDLDSYSKQAHLFYDKIKSLESTISQLEKSQSDALSNDMCEHAQQIGLSIISAHQKLIDSYNGLSTALECAMNLANDAPKHMDEHSKSSEKDIPQLRVRQSAMLKRMTALVDLQENDKQTLEVQRSKVSTTIRELNQPLKEHRKKHQEMAEQLESQVKEAERPFKERIEILTEEKASHNKRIAELLSEIESHKNAINGINIKIADEEKMMKKETDVFAQSHKALQIDERSLLSEAKTVAQKQRELESPFIDLQETVKKRDEEIATLSSILDQVGHEIHEAEQEFDDSQAASDIILEMCSSHTSFKVARSVIKSKFDAARKAAIDAEARLNQINTEMKSINLEKEKAGKKIDEAMSQIPQLESSKKAYVSTKNFKGAQVVAKQLKETQENLEAAKNFVEKSQARLNDLLDEEKKIKADSMRLNEEGDELRKELNKTDFEFYSKASDLLVALCKSSPFAEKLLAPLKDLVIFACQITEPPKEPTVEELKSKLEDLNIKINKAISEEKFDEAENLQKQIDRITVKIERLCEENT